MSDSVRPHKRQPTRLSRPWDSPGKNTGVGFHFLLQCMKVKSESEVAQSCPTPSDPMDCSLPGSSVHGIFQARVLEWGAIAFFYSILPHSILKSPTFSKLRDRSTNLSTYNFSIVNYSTKLVVCVKNKTKQNKIQPSKLEDSNALFSD